MQAYSGAFVNLVLFFLLAAFRKILFIIGLFSAAILAPPVPSNGFELDTIASDCDHGDADDFVPKKRERNPAIWFDVPNRGGIGMIHVAKRKCPEIMFRYLNQLSQRDGREGWLFPTLEKDSCISPSKVILLFFVACFLIALFHLWPLLFCLIIA